MADCLKNQPSAALVAFSCNGLAVMKVTGQEAFDKALNALKECKGVELKVGYFEDATYPSGLPVAVVAAIAEHGFPPRNIPARPIFRPTIAKHEQEWREKLSSGMRAIMQGNTTIDHVLDAIGGLAAGDVAHTISKINSPPLKKSTVKARINKLAKGARLEATIAKPLVETGILIKVQWDVSKTGGTMKRGRVGSK